MDQGRSTHRLYSDKEVGALIQRATELHEAALGASEHSLSLAEIEHIAAELGLPPEHVRAAAFELEGHQLTGTLPRLWGGPFVVDHKRVMDEVLTEAQWEQVVLALREFTGNTGHISEVGRAREWTHSLKEGEGGMTIAKTQVTLRPEEVQTSITIRKHYGGGAFMAYMLSVVLSVTLTGMALDGSGLSDPLLFTLVGVAGLGGLAAVRASLSVWARRQRERLTLLGDLLQHTVVASAPRVLANEPLPERVELPDRDEPEPTMAEARPTSEKTRTG